MHLFYVDEAGCLGQLILSTCEIQPVFAIGGIILEQAKLEAFTRDFLDLKNEFFPGLRPATGEFLDWIKVEIKGADLRKHVRAGGRDKRRHALRFLEKLIEIFEKYQVKICGRIFVKRVGAPMDGIAVYSSSIQSMAFSFQNFLSKVEDIGMMVLDSRTKSMNTTVSHSIFTQKFKYSGDAYSRILDMPIFGHSDNHAGIQAADLLCSAFLFPMAAYAYCMGHISNIHVDYKYHLIRDRFGLRLKALQYRYESVPGAWKGGIWTSDGLTNNHAALLFGPK